MIEQRPVYLDPANIKADPVACLLEAILVQDEEGLERIRREIERPGTIVDRAMTSE